MWRRIRSASPSDATPPASRSITASRWVVGVSALVFLLVLTNARPWHLFDAAPFSATFYDEQARAFLHGHLAVDPAVPGPEGFVIGGKTYLYYGPFLAIARLPFALFGHVFWGRLVRLSLLVGYVTLLTAAFHLAELARRTVAPWRGTRSVDVWWRTPLFVAAVACSPALFLSGWISVYHETEMWACAFAAWAIVGALRLLESPSRRTAVLAGAAAAASTLTRASVGLGAVATVGLIALIAWFRSPTHAIGHFRSDSVRKRPLTEGWMVGVAALGVVGHLGTNLAKFGSLTDLPGDKQLLTMQNAKRAAWFAGNDGSFFGTRFLKTTIAQYLRPDTIRFERLFPFLRFGPPAPNYGSYPTESTTPAASLTATATLLLVAAVVGVVILLRRRGWPWLATVVGGCVAAAPSFLIGFIGNRYLVDMLPALLAPAAIAIAVAPLPAGRAVRRAVQVGLALLVAFGMWGNTALAIWVADLKDPGFTAWRYQLDDHLFGNPAPGIVALDPNAPVPRDGIVALDVDGEGTCRGVYVAEQGAWAVLERTAGHRRYTGTLFVDGPDTIIDVLEGMTDDGTGWGITAEVAEDSVQVVLHLPDGDTAGDPVHVDLTGVQQAALELPLAVVVDPISHELSVAVRGRQVLFSFAAPFGTAVPGAAFHQLADDGGDSLCRQLEARR